MAGSSSCSHGFVVRHWVSECILESRSGRYMLISHGIPQCSLGSRGCGFRLASRVHSGLNDFGLWVVVPGEEGAKGEMLDDGELGEDFDIVHFNHALVDLGPAGLDARDVEEDGAVFPKRPGFDVVDEANGAEIHVAFPFALHGCGVGNVGGGGRAGERALGCYVGGRADGG